MQTKITKRSVEILEKLAFAPIAYLGPATREEDRERQRLRRSVYIIWHKGQWHITDDGRAALDVIRAAKDRHNA